MEQGDDDDDDGAVLSLNTQSPAPSAQPCTLQTSNSPLNRNQNILFLSLRRSRFFRSYFYFSLLPSSSASSPLTHTFIFSSAERAAHIHTDKHQQFVVNNELSVLIQCVCVCWGRGLYSCPLTGGGGIFFSPRGFYLFFFFETCPSFPLSLYLYLTWRKWGNHTPSVTSHPFIGNSPEATPPCPNKTASQNQNQFAGSSDDPSLLSLCFTSTSLALPPPPPPSVQPVSFLLLFWKGQPQSS